MQRELTYKLSYKRIAKLARSMGRKVYGRGWLFLLLAVYMIAVIATGFYSVEIERWMIEAGLPDLAGLPFWICLALFVAAILIFRKAQIRRIQSRANFDSEIRMTREESGLRFVTDSIEYFVKWNGIAQVLLEPDGVVVSHGNLFWLIPDTAFQDAAERRAFIEDVYGRLDETARGRSEKYVRAALSA